MTMRTGGARTTGKGFALRIWGKWTLPIWQRSDCF
jgi:hypothetical protein